MWSTFTPMSDKPLSLSRARCELLARLPITNQEGCTSEGRNDREIGSILLQYSTHEVFTKTDLLESTL